MAEGEKRGREKERVREKESLMGINRLTEESYTNYKVPAPRGPRGSLVLEFWDSVGSR